MDKILRTLALSSNVANVRVYADNGESFERMVDFDVEGQSYTIEYYPNICYLYIGNAKVPFASVELSGTWPSGYRNNLQFSDNRGEIVCIIGADKYDHG